jgi:hypothetical protein
LAARRHWRFVVRDQYGFVIQNAKVNVYLPGTTTVFAGTAYDAASGGSPVTNPFTTNAFGEVEAWFDTAQVVDVQVDDNSNLAYRAVGGVSDTQDFATFTEKDDIYVSASDQYPDDSLLPTGGVGAAGDITDIDPGDATAAGASGKWADAAHQHENTAVPNNHGAAEHSNITRSLFLPVGDVTTDGGTIAVRGTAPDALRVLTLADAASSGHSWTFAVPDDWASGALAWEIWHAGQTTTSGSVRWTVDVLSAAEGASIVAAGSSSSFTGQAPTTADLLVKETVLGLVTPAAAGDLIRVNVRRIGADGADTYAASTSLIGVLVTYTANQ